MKITFSYPGVTGPIASFAVGLLALVPQQHAQAQPKPVFFESFEGAPFVVSASVDSLQGWKVSASNPSLDHNAGVIRSGIAPDGAQYLEVSARGTEPSDSTRIVNDLGGEPISLSPGRALRIAVAMNYVNLDEFSSSGGIIFRVYTDQGDFAVSFNAKNQSALLLRKPLKARASETQESGRLIKRDTWYRFVINLRPAASLGENAEIHVTLSEANGPGVLWEVKGWDLGFSPSQITRVELASNRLAASEGHRIGHYDQIAISEVPSP